MSRLRVLIGEQRGPAHVIEKRLLSFGDLAPPAVRGDAFLSQEHHQSVVDACSGMLALQIAVERRSTDAEHDGDVEPPAAAWIQPLGDPADATGLVDRDAGCLLRQLTDSLFLDHKKHSGMT